MRIRPVYGDARVNEPVPSWHAQSEGQKTIFATLGTVNNRNQLLLRKHLEAVADQDYQVRMALGDAPTAAVPTALKSRTTNSLKSVPVNVRPESVLANVRPESLRANVHVERYVPVSQAVPTCAAVVSHGGRGTVLTALSHGVPVCSIPIFADQPVTASLVERFGAGLTCATGQVQMGPFALPVADPQELDPLHLRHQIQRTLTEPTFAEQARAIQSEIAELPGPEQVVHLMETVLAEAHHRPARGTLTQSPPA